MTDPVKEAVERLTDDLSRAREDGLVLTDAPNLRAVLAENARLVKLVEEAGEALERTAHALRTVFNQKPLRDMAETLAEAERVLKAITGGGE